MLCHWLPFIRINFDRRKRDFCFSFFYVFFCFLLVEKICELASGPPNSRPRRKRHSCPSSGTSSISTLIYIPAVAFMRPHRSTRRVCRAAGYSISTTTISLTCTTCTWQAPLEVPALPGEAWRPPRPRPLRVLISSTRTLPNGAPGGAWQSSLSSSP